MAIRWCGVILLAMAGLEVGCRAVTRFGTRAGLGAGVGSQLLVPLKNLDCFADCTRFSQGGRVSSWRKTMKNSSDPGHALLISVLN